LKKQNLDVLFFTWYFQFEDKQYEDGTEGRNAEREPVQSGHDDDQGRARK